MINANLPRPPSTNNLYANNRSGGRYKTKEYKTWINAAGWDLKTHNHSRISGEVQIAIGLGRERNKDGSLSRRRIDAGNFEKAISDLLVRHNLIDDDSFVSDLRIFWTTEVEPKRAQIYVQPAIS